MGCAGMVGGGVKRTKHESGEKGTRHESGKSKAPFRNKKRHKQHAHGASEEKKSTSQEKEAGVQVRKKRCTT